MTARTVLVTGATGKQGGAVARNLLRRGHLVRALVRDPTSPAASYLGRLGVDLRQGDLTDRSAVARAARGADAAFLMTTPFAEGAEAEVRQGIAALDGLRDAGVGQVVLSSVAGAAQSTGIPHFESKRQIEDHFRATRIVGTILAPVFFMENLLASSNLESLRSGALARPLPARRQLQQVALDDYGAFVAVVVERRDPFLGQRIEVASDELDGETTARLISDFIGRAIAYREVPLAQVRAASEDAARMFEWFDRVGYRADISGLRHDYPEVGWHRFEQWLRTFDRALFRESPVSAEEQQRSDHR